MRYLSKVMEHEPEASHQSNPEDELKTSLDAAFEQSDFSGIQTPADVEIAAQDILDTIPHAQDLMARIRAARENKQEDERAVRERAKLFKEVSIQVSLITGVEIDAAEHEHQRQAYKDQLKSTLTEIDTEASDEEIMLKLGMIKPVPGAQGHVFRFPSRLFPPFVREQWDAYISMVSQSEAAKNKLQRGLITQTEFNGIDIMRRKAHNTVSASIGEMLDFPGWDLKAYRRLAGKMRDEKFAEPKGEMAVYAEFFRKDREEFALDEHITKIGRRLGEQATSHIVELDDDEDDDTH